MKLVHIVDKDQNMWIDVNVFFQQSEMELTQWRSQIRERYKRIKQASFYLRLVPIPSDPCQTYRSHGDQFLGNIFLNIFLSWKIIQTSNVL